MMYFVKVYDSFGRYSRREFKWKAAAESAFRVAWGCGARFGSLTDSDGHTHREGRRA